MSAWSGALAERNAICRWLREAEGLTNEKGEFFPFSQRFLNWRWELADLIARGEHEVETVNPDARKETHS